MKPSPKLWLANSSRFKVRDWQVLDVRRATNVDLFILMFCPHQRGRQKSCSHLFYEVKWITSRAVHRYSSLLVNYSEVSTFTEPELEKYGASNIPSQLNVINACAAFQPVYASGSGPTLHICNETSVLHDLGCLYITVYFSYITLIHSD